MAVKLWVSGVAQHIQHEQLLSDVRSQSVQVTLLLLALDCCCLLWCWWCCRHLLLLACSFDLIFLDANKDGYQTYYDIAMNLHLLAPNGLLVVDNTLMKVGGG